MLFDDNEDTYWQTVTQKQLISLSVWHCGGIWLSHLTRDRVVCHRFNSGHSTFT